MTLYSSWKLAKYFRRLLFWRARYISRLFLVCRSSVFAGTYTTNSSQWITTLWRHRGDSRQDYWTVGTIVENQKPPCHQSTWGTRLGDMFWWTGRHKYRHNYRKCERLTVPILWHICTTVHGQTDWRTDGQCWLNASCHWRSCCHGSHLYTANDVQFLLQRLRSDF